MIKHLMFIVLTVISILVGFALGIWFDQSVRTNQAEGEWRRSIDQIAYSGNGLIAAGRVDLVEAALKEYLVESRTENNKIKAIRDLNRNLAEANELLERP